MSLFQRIKNVFTGQSKQEEEKVSREEAELSEEQPVDEVKPAEKEKIIEIFNLSQIQNTDPTYLSNTRSISIL